MDNGLRSTPSWPEGSVIIERYPHVNPNGVQWLVHRVKDGIPVTQKVCNTRREAAEFVRDLRG